ncbi:MAG TPA: ferrous iron transport protein B [Gemmataceae bacterium]
MLTRTLSVALVGNPNTGKTTLFNALSGLRQRVGNYPGVTVEMKKGTARDGDRAFDLIDLPGTYSLAARSPDEMVAVDLLLGHCPGEPRPDVVLAIVDASNLDRHLYLVTQLLELGRPVVVALNMLDVAEGQGLRIDAKRLSDKLGLPVVPIRANKGRGLAELRRAVWDAAESAAPANQPTFPEPFEQEVAALQEALGPDVEQFMLRRLLLDVGGYTERRLGEQYGPGVATRVAAARQRLAAAGCPVPLVEARTRYAWIKAITADCVTRPAVRPVTWTDRLDRLLTHRVWGTLVFLVVMVVVFQSIFTWARPAMRLIGAGKDWLADGLRLHLPPGPLTSLLTDGVLEGVGGVVMFLPQILILFAFIAMLEDCGYMARAAFLMDKLMARCGLSGKSFIPLLSSVACAVPGILATRVIENRRDRLATILVAPLMSCSARLPVYVLLIGAFLTTGWPWWLPGLTMFGLYAIGLVLAPLVALAFKRTLLRGDTPVFVMELPTYKVPSVRTVLRRVGDAAWAFLRRAGTLILASMVLVWALLYIPWWDGTGRYEDHIAAVRAPVEAQLKELEELNDATADRRRELRRLERTDADRAAELRAELAPQLQRIDELEKAVGPVEDEAHRLEAEWKRNSLLGRLGRMIEPAVRPLGWDWRVGVAALASFPAREVVVGTLGIVYRAGKVEADDIRDADWSEVGDTGLGRALREATWDGTDRPVFTVPAVLSLLVFFALCCQCASTLAVIRRETHSWRWPAVTFAYMTALAYVAALAVYQVGSLFV